MEGQKNPSLPSNYVTLLQLQEKWLKEKEGKQREKELEEKQQRQRQVREEEERRRQQQLELQQRQIEEEKVKKRENENPNVQKPGIKFKHGNHNGGMNRRNYRANSRENLKTAAVICTKPGKPEVEATEADSRNENAEKERNGLEMFKKKQKKTKKKKGKKKEHDLAKPSAEVDATNPRAEGDLAESTAHASEGNFEVIVRGSKHLPAEDCRTENSRARKIGEKKRLTVESKPKTGNLDLAVGIEHKIRHFSVNGKSKRGNDGFRRLTTGGRRGFDSSFGRQEVGKHSGAGMVWVRKGEVSNGIIREFRSQVASERTDALSGSH